jgi:hypothetical protein
VIALSHGVELSLFHYYLTFLIKWFELSAISFISTEMIMLLVWYLKPIGPVLNMKKNIVHYWSSFDS